MKKSIVLSPFASEVIARLEENGYQAYAVGGCVRNSLMGLPVYDYDITTSALPNEIKTVFSDLKTVETGIKHGTVTVLKNKEQIEITTFRTDGKYTDYRHPDNVSFTADLKDDLSRRDFTVNAAAYSEKSGIIDIFGGTEDIKDNILRCVGEAEKRFEEDALRIMRGLRFMAVYGFKPDEKTRMALHRKKHLLKAISPQRISGELSKLLCGKAEYLYYVLTDYWDILAEVIPEIKPCVGFQQKTHYHNKDVWEHTVSAVCNVEPVLYLRLAMLFHDLGKPLCYQFYGGEGHFKGHASISTEICVKELENLHFDSATSEKVVFLVKRHDMTMKDDPLIIKKQLNKYGEELFFDLIKVHIADDLAKAEKAQGRIIGYQNAAKTALKIIEQQECFSLKNLALNGNDIIAKGYKGKEVGDVLKMLLNAVIEGKCNNTKEDLLNYLVNNKNVNN